MLQASPRPSSTFSSAPTQVPSQPSTPPATPPRTPCPAPSDTLASEPASLPAQLPRAVLRPPSLAERPAPCADIPLVDLSVPSYLLSARTGAVLTEPVLTSSGESINRSEAGPDETVYENRVLRNAIAQRRELLGQPQAASTAAADWREARCIFSTSAFTEAAQVVSGVVDKDSGVAKLPEDHNYDVTPLAQWIRSKGTSPHSNDPYMAGLTVVPNLAVTDMCRDFDNKLPLSDAERAAERVKCAAVSMPLRLRVKHSTAPARRRLGNVAYVLVVTCIAAGVGAALGAWVSGSTSHTGPLAGASIGASIGVVAGGLFLTTSRRNFFRRTRAAALSSSAASSAVPTPMLASSHALSPV